MWVEKYRPKVYLDIKGQDFALKKIKEFINEFNLGKISNPQIAKYFIGILIKQPELNQFQKKLDGIDWSSHKDLNVFFKKMLSSLEKNLVDIKEPA